MSYPCRPADFTGILIMRDTLSRILTGTGRFISLFTVFFLLFPSSAWAQVTGMRVGSGAARIRIVLDMDSTAKFKDRSTQDQIALEIDTAVKNRIQRKLDDASVSDVVLEKIGKKSARLEISLKKPSQHKVLVLKNPNRIVIDVYTPASAAVFWAFSGCTYEIIVDRSFSYFHFFSKEDCQDPRRSSQSRVCFREHIHHRGRLKYMSYPSRCRSF